MTNQVKTREDREALLYLAAYIRGDCSRWKPRLWWRAIDLLPYPYDLPVNWSKWAPIAESLACEGR